MSKVETKYGSPERLRGKILHMLWIFPKLMPSMLHVGIGPSTSSRDWRPVLDQLVVDGLVIKEESSLRTPIGQYRTYTVLSLSDGARMALDRQQAEWVAADMKASHDKHEDDLVLAEQLANEEYMSKADRQRQWAAEEADDEELEEEATEA